MKLTSVCYFALYLSAATARPSERSGTSACAIRGYDKGRPSAYFYSSSPKYQSQSSCAARCASDSLCLSYAFGDDTCLGYKSAVYVIHFTHSRGTFSNSDVEPVMWRPKVPAHFCSSTRHAMTHRHPLVLASLLQSASQLASAVEERPAHVQQTLLQALHPVLRSFVGV